jgi:NADH pyrophosphatase NudC (nudix superfamily)
MGIAISTIAIITGKRWPWQASLVLGALGCLVAAVAYV